MMKDQPTSIRVCLGAAANWHLPHTARAFENKGALAGFYTSEKNATKVSSDLFHRCWSFHLPRKPILQFAPQILSEKLFYGLFPIWRSWIKSQQFPACNVVHAIAGFGTTFFDYADRIGALKVLDCPNSHPTTYLGNWQRECDLWCPGENVPIPQWMFARMNRELERADLIIVQSTFCKESMVLNGISPDKVMVNPLGVDTDLFIARESIPLKPRFICVGTICLRKGHQYLFRAFEKVKARMPEAELICAGQYKVDFRMERKKWEGTFTHYEHLNHSELAPLLRTCTAFVFISQEEGIARAQIEALAAGLPLIGTHEGGATTLVNDGIEGFIVRGRDADHIADAMLRIAGDPLLCERMGKAAHKAGAEMNSWQDYGDRLLAEYQNRLAIKRGKQ